MTEELKPGDVTLADLITMIDMVENHTDAINLADKLWTMMQAPAPAEGALGDRDVALENVVYHLDDVEVDTSGLCKWTDVANALQHIKACAFYRSPADSIDQRLEEAGKAAIAIRNELDRTRADRDYQADLATRWKAQFDSAAAAASEYSEFWEKHSGDFDQFGNYVPYSQMDGDLRAARAEIEKLRSLSQPVMEIIDREYYHGVITELRAQVESATELGRAAAYCIARLSDAFKGNSVRDLDEAEEAYRSALRKFQASFSLSSTERQEAK